MYLNKFLCFIFIMLFSNGVWAIDAVKSKPPQQIIDNQLSIGDRTLTLPKGIWNYVGVVEDSIRGMPSGNVLGKKYNTYAIEVADGFFVQGLEIYLPLNIVGRGGGWMQYACGGEKNLIFKKDFDSPFMFQECLQVYK